jgi:hypothetical protein
MGIAELDQAGAFGMFQHTGLQTDVAHFVVTAGRGAGDEAHGIS